MAVQAAATGEGLERLTKGGNVRAGGEMPERDGGGTGSGRVRQNGTMAAGPVHGDSDRMAGPHSSGVAQSFRPARGGKVR